ncbi:hypothetical protein [Streptomyces broussonetiae]|uniref:Uncharacterized protein n=1 Tax=Streptomyces broussonetiae TaxID=2686304 RepID=A0ABV5EHI4_9ACTN
MFRPDRSTLRSAGFVLLLACVFVGVNSQVVYAAETGGTGDLIGPLNITSSEGVPIDGYELNAEGGSVVAFETQALAFALSGLFTVIRLLVGLAGWAIELALRFPLLAILTAPAQEAADAYDRVVVDALGLKGLLLAWAFFFCGFMIVRGRVGRGLGEIFLTLLIGALAASVFVRPDYLLAEGGPLGQSQQVGLAVAQESVNAYDWGGKISRHSPCAGMTGAAEMECWKQEGRGPVAADEVARPLQDSITNALVVKPFMLLQYGRILDPGKASDRKAYAVHLKWITGGYKAVEDPGPGGKDPCDLIKGEGKKWCERDTGDTPARQLPSLTPGGELLDATNALVTDEDREFAAFVEDMSKAGDVGKAAAAYAKEPSWWRVGGTGLLLVAALFVCGMLLSSTIVLLGTQGVCVAAAAVAGITFVAGMLPGPARQSVWKWLSLWGIAVLALVGICAFIPAFGIAVDATITNGPDLVVERLLLITVLAIAGAAAHRRLLTGIASFSRRMAMRMRYAKIGGTHLPGDTSELGAALAMNSPAALGGYGGGLRAFATGGGGRYRMLGTRQRLMGALSSLLDGAGMPVDTGRVLADATAEAGRGLAPLTAGAAVAGLGARLGVRGAHGLLIGKRPDGEQLAKWRKPTAEGDEPSSGQPPGGSGGGSGPGGGPRQPGGPPDRYRDDDGQIVDRDTGQVLHDQNADRTLLSTRAHNRLVRFRGYRILHRGGRAAYGTTVGLPGTVRQGLEGGSRYSQDARRQVRVWANTVREDGRAWAGTGRHVARVLGERTDDRGGPGPFVSRRLLTRPAVGGRATGSSRPSGRTSPETSAPGSALTTSSAPPDAAPTSTTRLRGGAPLSSASPPPDRSRPVLPGGAGAQSATRDEARARFQELMRRTEPDAERLRQERNRQPEDGEDE